MSRLTAIRQMVVGTSNRGWQVATTPRFGPRHLASSESATASRFDGSHSAQMPSSSQALLVPNRARDSMGFSERSQLKSCLDSETTTLYEMGSCPILLMCIARPREGVV